MSQSVGEYKIAIVGGAGHVGAPLAITLALKGWPTLVYDINARAVEQMRQGRLGFTEEGGQELLERALKQGGLGFSTDPKDLQHVEYVIITIGTPVDEFHNPSLSLVIRCIDDLLPHLRNGQTLVLRSTV